MHPENTPAVASAEPPSPVVVTPSREVKLDLACGQAPREGFEGVDLFAETAKHKVDLLKFPLPWADNSVDEINCSHFIEHIHAREVEERDLAAVIHETLPQNENHWKKSFVGQDMLFAFFDELYRILKPGGTVMIVCPSVRNERAFWDPTHRRFISQVTFCYLSKTWRVAQKLDHYRVMCDFEGNVAFSHSNIHAGRHVDVQQRAFAESWNVIVDYIATLKAMKK